MNSYQYLTILGTIWISSYKPDALNLVVGGIFLVLAVHNLIKEANAASD